MNCNNMQDGVFHGGDHDGAFLMQNWPPLLMSLQRIIEELFYCLVMQLSMNEGTIDGKKTIY